MDCPGTSLGLRSLIEGTTCGPHTQTLLLNVSGVNAEFENFDLGAAARERMVGYSFT